MHLSLTKQCCPNRIWSDRRVVLWDFHPLNDLSAPLVYTGPRVSNTITNYQMYTELTFLQANILSLAFTASNNLVLSLVCSINLFLFVSTKMIRGGLDQEVFQYDVSRMNASPLAERPIHGDLSLHDVCERRRLWRQAPDLLIRQRAPFAVSHHMLTRMNCSLPEGTSFVPGMQYVFTCIMTGLATLVKLFCTTRVSLSDIVAWVASLLM